MSEVTALVPAAELSEREQIAALEAEIERGRQRVVSSLDELHGRLQRATSWRHWVGAHPGTWICVGLCLGLLFERGTRRR